MSDEEIDFLNAIMRLNHEGEAIRILTRYHVNPNLKVEDGVSALQHAMSKKMFSLVEIILSMPDIDITCMSLPDSYYYGLNMLHYAILKDAPLRVVRLLTSHRDIDINAQTVNGDTVLHLLGWKRGDLDMQVLAQILSVPGVRLDIKNYLGDTPLNIFVLYPRNTMAVSVIRQKFPELDPNIQNNKGFAPLHRAVSASLDMVNEILGCRNVNVNVQDEDGKTPLHIAAKNKDVHIVRRLLSVPGIYTNIVDVYGRKAENYAGPNGFVSLPKTFASLNNVNVIEEPEHLRGQELTNSISFNTIEPGSDYYIAANNTGTYRLLGSDESVRSTLNTQLRGSSIRYGIFSPILNKRVPMTRIRRTKHVGGKRRTRRRVTRKHRK
jgi:ankyrin repeat protein